MRRFLYCCAVFCALFILSVGGGPGLADASPTTHPVYPQINYGQGPRAAQIKRGEYLAKLGDCIGCHTTAGGKSFAGGFALKTPFGVIYTPNLTPDKETGLGSWSLADFTKAMHEGISPQGQYYYPAFPYIFFNKITTEDLSDLWAYLQAIPPVHEVNKKNNLSWPFNWRFLQLGWRILFFHFQKTGPYSADPQHSALWNRGNYLTNSLPHCGMCHTPSYYAISKNYPLAAPIEKYAFSGNTVEGYYAPDITGRLLKNVPLPTFANVFKKNQRIGGGGGLQGPMQEANRNGLQYLTTNDIQAIYVYLQSVKSQVPPKPSSTNKSVLTQGKTIYEQYCTGCHTTGAGGAPKMGDAAAWDPILKAGMATVYQNAMQGIDGMPPKGNCSSCTEQEIRYAVDYLVGQKSSGVPANRPPPIQPLTMADGQRLYEQHCASCHAKGVSYDAPKVGDQATWQPIIKQGVDSVILHTINGYGRMAPRGGCTQCNDAQIKAAVKYMIQNSQTGGDYSLW